MGVLMKPEPARGCAECTEYYADDNRQERDLEEDESKDSYRTAPQRDRDRILYSSAFRRLADVTQVVAAQNAHLLHNRLTHSLKVAQIGRRMAERLERERLTWGLREDRGVFIDPDVVEAAGLAHDLGHPPFGHTGEKALEEKVTQALKLHAKGAQCESNKAIECKHAEACKGENPAPGKQEAPKGENAAPGMQNDRGGFEGNPQSFRIVTKIAVGHEGDGLNLTRATLNAILKYPCTIDQESDDKNVHWADRSYGKRKWGVYATERDVFEWARDTTGLAPGMRSPEAILMDWADDVSYATHDLEDYVRAGFISFSDLKREQARFLARAATALETKHGRTFSVAKLGEAWEQLLRDFPPQPYSGSREDRKLLRDFTSNQVNQCLEAVSIRRKPPHVEIDVDVQYRVEALKQLTWFYVIDGPALAAAQEGQREIVATLFDKLRNWLTNESDSRSPRQLVELKELQTRHAGNVWSSTEPGKEEYIVTRAVADYICTLTETQALDLYERISGASRASVFGTWFR